MRVVAALGVAAVVAGFSAATPASRGQAAADRPSGSARIEVLRPSGTPLGAILVVHGGGWRDVGAAKLARVRPWAERFRSWGYEVWSTTYRPGRASLRDVLAAYDRLRAATPRPTPTCLYGQSAGGHLALLVAARRPGARGVISVAGPTHLRSLPPATRGLARDAFGPELRRFSPVRHASRIRARLLLEYAPRDRLVPFSQGEALDRARPGSGLVAVPVTPLDPAARPPEGTVSWVHGVVPAPAARQVWQRERRWLAATCRRPAG